VRYRIGHCRFMSFVGIVTLDVFVDCPAGHALLNRSRLAGAFRDVSKAVNLKPKKVATSFAVLAQEA